MADLLHLHRRMNIRKTHPTLYHSIMIVGAGCVALAINFWTSTPTFNPFGIPKNLVGAVFAFLGLSQLFFLNVLRDLRKIRIGLATTIFTMTFWGLANLEQSIAGRASYQLPILYVMLALIQVPLLIEAPVNTMTEKKS